jgi:hypothetical protein
MDKRLFQPLVTLIILGLLITACNLPIAPTQQPPKLDLVKTAAAQTVVARLTEAAQQGGLQIQPSSTPTTAPPPTQTPPPPLPPKPTDTPTPTETVTPSPTPTEVCDRAAFVKDVTVPDNTKFAPGETFTKEWEIKNIGVCIWNSAYQAFFHSGEKMGAPDSVQITTGTVAPGQSVIISVDMKAPTTPGTYQGFWKLRNPDGVVFGIGASGTSAFWVKIKVKAGPNFDMVFENTHTCGGLTYATFRIDDTGAKFFESAEIYIKDLDDGTDIYGPATNDKPFMVDPNDCPPGNSDTDPNTVPYYIAVSIDGATSGHTARARITLCTEDGLGGNCVKKEVDFTIP